MARLGLLPGCSAGGLRLSGWLFVWALAAALCRGEGSGGILQLPAAPSAAAGWTSSRHLPDSTTHLPWSSPRQATTTPADAPRPSFLRSSTPAATATLPRQLAASPEVIKVSHDTPLPRQARPLVERSRPTAGVPRPSGSNEPPELSLQPAANAQRAVVAYVAQPPQRAPAEGDAQDVFGDELDDLLPGEELVPSDESVEPGLGLPAEVEGLPAAEPLAAPRPTPANPPIETLQEPTWPAGPPDQLPSLNDNDLPPLDQRPADGSAIEPIPGPPAVAPDETVPWESAQLEGEAAFDCPDEIRVFQQAWDELRQKPLSSISLDITPSMRPTKDAEQAEQARQELTSRTSSRTWHDKRGRVLAEGQLQDFRDGEVWVQTPQGPVEPLSWYDLSNEDLCYVSSSWELPKEFSPATGPFQVRNWTMLTFTWTASAVCHKPLYFEEVQLERYGHSAGPVSQAMLSGVHFFGNIFFLPYHFGLNPPNECQYALGYYRPGSCAPWMLPAIPLSARGARMQTSALVGGLLWLP